MKNITKKNIAMVDLGNLILYVSLINGMQVLLPKGNKELHMEVCQSFEKIGMLENYETGNYEKDELKTITISINASSKCNLNCNYCFRTGDQTEEVMYADAVKFINMIVANFPSAHKYIVDVSGSGEPLLQLKKILAINKYCKAKSDELGKEILVMLVSNGVLLKKETSKKLQAEGILFGVSVDGDAAAHNSCRIDRLGNATYRKVMRNVEAIENRAYVGAAVTLTKQNNDMIKILKHHIKFFPTIAMKIARSENGQVPTRQLIPSYTQLFNFLIKRLQNNDFKYIYALLNGDDYFGKFLLRAILEVPIIARCDGGIARFSLAADGKIYTCPAGVRVEELQIGELNTGIDFKKINRLYELQIRREGCTNCYAKFVCGGECFRVAYNTHNNIAKPNKNMCKVKRHIFKLTILLKAYLSATCEYQSILNKCEEILNRKLRDEDLSQALSKSVGYTFTQLKKLKDEQPSEYEKVRKENG